MKRSLVNNAIIGISSGYNKTLELTGVGYRAALKGKQLNLQLGLLIFPPGLLLHVKMNLHNIKIEIKP